MSIGTVETKAPRYSLLSEAPAQFTVAKEYATRRTKQTGRHNIRARNILEPSVSPPFHGSGLAFSTARRAWLPPHQGWSPVQRSSARIRRRLWLSSEGSNEGLRARRVHRLLGEAGMWCLATSPNPWCLPAYHQSGGCQSPGPPCSSGVRAEIALTRLRAACWIVGSTLCGQLFACCSIPRFSSFRQGYGQEGCPPCPRASRRPRYVREAVWEDCTLNRGKFSLLRNCSQH